MPLKLVSPDTMLCTPTKPPIKPSFRSRASASVSETARGCVGVAAKVGLAVCAVDGTDCAVGAACVAFGFAFWGVIGVCAWRAAGSCSAGSDLLLRPILNIKTTPLGFWIQHILRAKRLAKRPGATGTERDTASATLQGPFARG